MNLLTSGAKNFITGVPTTKYTITPPSIQGKNAARNPDASLSQTKGNEYPFAEVNVRIDHPMSRTQYVTGVQIFAGEVSVQEAFMEPVDNNNPIDDRAQRFDISKQNL